MKFLTLTILALAHLAGPGLVEAPTVTEVQALRQRVRHLEAIELWAIRNGVKITINGRVWR